MKKLLGIIFFLLIFTWTSIVPAQQQQVFARIRDNDNKNVMADVLQSAATLAATVFGLVTDAVTYYFSDGVWYRWSGDTLNSDDIVATTRTPRVGSFLHYLVGTTWDRITGRNAADDISATQQGVDTIAYTHFYDDANFRRWTGAAFGDAMAAAPVAPYVVSLNSFYDGINNRRWTGTTAADSLALPTAPWTLSALMGFDGATMARLIIDAVGGLLTGRTWAIAGEDSSADNLKVNINHRTPTHGAPEISGQIVGAAVVICTARDTSTDNKGCFYIKNEGGGGAGPFTAATWSTSSDNVDWTDPIDLGAPCNALTTGKVCHFCWDDSLRWMRASAAAAAAVNDTTGKCTYEGQN